MIRLSGLWRKYLRFLQIFDLSVGADIRRDCLILVKIRKTVFDFKVKSCTVLPAHNENFRELLEQYLSDTSGFSLPGYRVNIDFPLNLSLPKRIPIPLIREQEIYAFLNRTPEVFLPLKLDFKKIMCVSEIMGRTTDSWNLLVFLIKKHDLEAYFSLIRGKTRGFHIVAGLWPWLNLCQWRDPHFSGTFYATDNDSNHVIKINSGAVSDYMKYPIDNEVLSSEEDSAVVRDDIYCLEIEGNESSSLLSGLNAIIPGTMDAGKGRFNSRYLKALALSMIAFYPPATAPDGLDFPLRAEGHRLFFRHLLVKSLLIWGLLTIGLYLFSIVVSGVLHYYLSDQQEKHAGLKNFLAEKEKLLSANVQYHKQLAGYQSLLVTSFRMAWYVYSVARAIPDESWLSHIEIRNSGKFTSEVNLTGYVFSEQALSQILKNLENLEFVRTADLKEVVLTDAAEGKLLKKIKAQKILKFRIDCHV